MNTDLTDPSTAAAAVDAAALYSVALPSTLAAEHLPPGYGICWSFLDATEPWALALMLDPIAGLADDERRARQIAADMGVVVTTIPAPDALRTAGVIEIGVYPAAVLEQVFPVNR